MGQPLALLENQGSGGHWLIVDPGVPAPGMVVRVELPDLTVLERSATVGGGWLSSEDPRLHFGLGPNDRIDLVEVTYPDGTTVRFEDVDADQVLSLG
ncbi:MAG: ASPIC/UnbV domain-containing protein [Acidimicrobiales bacterium]